MRAWAALVCLAAACDGGQIVAGGMDAGVDAGMLPVGTIIKVTAPAEGAMILKDYLAADGKWVAEVTFTAQAAKTVASVDWMLGDTVKGIGLPPDFAYTTRYSAEGDLMLDAVARDPIGGELGRATVHYSIAPSSAGTSCAGILDTLKVKWTSGPTTMGITSPVTITMPLNGLPFTFYGEAVPRATWLMDCQLAVALWRLTDAFKQHGVVAVTDLGIYSYRCIDQTELPPCPTSHFSMHAFGLAVDVAAFTTVDGASYSVMDDWIIDVLPSGQDTCSVRPNQAAKNVFMHDLLCEMYADQIFKIFLTPNYNAAHRNHWHMDLTDQMTEIVH